MGLEIIEIEGREFTRETMLENLRGVGCPEWLSARVVEKRFRPGYSRKQTVAGNGGDRELIDILRRAARAMGAELAVHLRDCPNCAGGGDDVERMRMVRGHLDNTAALLECAASTAEQVENIFNGMDEEEDDSLRMTSATYQARRKKLRAMHAEFHRMLGETCTNHARMRLSAGQIFD